MNQSATIRVDAGAWQGKLAHNWTYIGYDEINYTYVPEGQELLAKFGEMQEQPSMTDPEQARRRQRVLERRMAQRLEGADLDAWYAKLDRRWQDPARLTTLLVPIDPAHPPHADSDPARFIRDLALDPVFQLK